MSTRALEALDRILSRGEDADDVLRAAIDVIVEEPGIVWAAVVFEEDGKLTVGPEAGAPEEGRRLRVPVTYGDSTVGELWVDGEAPRELLEQFALLLADHVLIGWDTQGEPWHP